MTVEDLKEKKLNKMNLMQIWLVKYYRSSLYKLPYTQITLHYNLQKQFFYLSLLIPIFNFWKYVCKFIKQYYFCFVSITFRFVCFLSKQQ